ncbi:MAG TPA: NAD(P)-dependent oxidoreductase [Candidatus Scybalocola faecavium]|nr:NAD(P)-dependent oxidoreductase [Candidatus Scybalocola faecavium]
MKIGFIGLGIMGEAMCYNILKKHDDQVFIYDIEPKQVEKVAGYGGIPCENSKEVAQKSDMIITVVPRSQNSMDVYSQIRDVVDDTKVCVDMSTIDPDVSLEIRDMLAQKGCTFLDAPVVKSQEAAWLGDVGIYVGGPRDVYDQVKPVLKYMGRSIIHMGDHGKGLIMKICHNALVAQIQNGVNETLALARINGIDLDKYSAAISYGVGQNYYYDSKQIALMNRDYTTQFSVENMAKDLDICHRMIQSQNIEMPGLEVSRDIYKEALEKGMGPVDYCSTVELTLSRSRVEDES